MPMSRKNLKLGISINQFLAQAAQEKAEKVIEREIAFAQKRKEFIRLLELLEHPPARNEQVNQAVVGQDRKKE